MSKALEERFFEVCLNKEKKDIMSKALDNQLDSLERIQASRMMIQEITQLK